MDKIRSEEVRKRGRQATQPLNLLAASCPATITADYEMRIYMNNTKINNLKSNDELIEELLSPAEKSDLMDEIAEEVRKTRGGYRKGAGRKPQNGVVLKFQIRVSEKEKEFSKYAREHHLDYDVLMEG